MVGVEDGRQCKDKCQLLRVFWQQHALPVILNQTLKTPLKQFFNPHKREDKYCEANITSEPESGFHVLLFTQDSVQMLNPALQSSQEMRAHQTQHIVRASVFFGQGEGFTHV
eukprot:1357809-Amphidinium_carterae.1